MGQYRLVIFDLDGTILDTLDDLADAVNSALKDCGYPALEASAVRRHIGNGITEAVRQSVPEGCPAEEITRVREHFIRIYPELCCRRTRPYPGVQQVMKELRKEGIHVAVVSNKIDRAVRLLCETFYPEEAEYCAGEKEGIPAKPAPDMFRLAMDAFHVRPSETICVGDSEVDIKTAQNVGIPCVVVGWGYRDHAFLEAQGAGPLACTAQDLLRRILQ